MDAAGVALWSWNVDTDRITLDNKALELWGVESGATVTFEELSSQIHPEDMDKVREDFAAARQAHGPFETDFRITLGKEIRWISARGRSDEEGIRGSIMYGVFLDVSVRKLAEEARELIAGEMHHRIKNLFALASALAGASSRSTTSKEEMTRDLKQRLIALSEAHDLIRPDSRAPSRACELADLLSVLLRPYQHGDSVDTRIMISVPKLLVGEQSATAMALVVHELATNSVKYGALSSAMGNLLISGQDRGGDIEIGWQESGGPSIEAAPQSAGFGSKLVRATVEGQLGGTISIDWLLAGIAVSLKLDKARLAA